MEWSDHWVSIKVLSASCCVSANFTFAWSSLLQYGEAKPGCGNEIVDYVQSRVAQPSLFTATNELTKNGKRSCRYVDVLSTFSSILALHISSLEGNVLVFLSQIILNIIFLLSSPILRRAWCQWSSRIELKAIWGTIKRRGCWTWKHRLEFCEPRDIW